MEVAAGQRVEARQGGEHAALAAARAPDEGGAGADGDVQGKAVEDEGAVAVVAEPHSPCADGHARRALQHRNGAAAIGIALPLRLGVRGLFGWEPNELHNALNGHELDLDIGDAAGEPHQVAGHAHGVRQAQARDAGAQRPGRGAEAHHGGHHREQEGPEDFLRHGHPTLHDPEPIRRLLVCTEKIQVLPQEARFVPVSPDRARAADGVPIVAHSGRARNPVQAPQVPRRPAVD
mmetsp:Transcript_29084/g.84208  ORF Transcript_29084/g.84208 Transcript_29084/m.84208 type:complete len:234 (-) Transcript_29084:1341-2042(-)